MAAKAMADQPDIEIVLGQRLDWRNLFMPLRLMMAMTAETKKLSNVNVIISAAIVAALVTVDDGAVIGAIAQTS